MGTEQKPVYLLAGAHRGAKHPDPILQAVFRESGIKSPSIAYIGAPSGDDRNFFRFISTGFTAAGAGEVTMAPLVKTSKPTAKARTIIENADIVFLSGGDVNAGMEVLQRHDLAGFLTELFRAGKPFFGHSAGAIMLGTEWIRWTDPEDASSAELFPCLGIAPVICDTHAEEDDWEELKALLAMKPEGSRGYGIATGTALRIAPDGTVNSLGGNVPCYIKRDGTTEHERDIVPDDR